MPLLIAAALSCIAIDGDTLRCGPEGRAGAEHVRLIGIDAPEMRGHCRRGRLCAPGDPLASQRALQRAVAGRKVVLERFGVDRWGRTLAIATAGRVNLSCAQLRAGQAIYVARWDEAGRIRRCALIDPR